MLIPTDSLVAPLAVDVRLRFHRALSWSLPAILLTACLYAAPQKGGKPPSNQESTDYYRKWLREDVVYIISPDEKDVFQKLTSDEEREKFIEQFWLRRDPDPRTGNNEYREEHYRRIAYANEKYTSGDPGWMTDRGKVYIIHGPPDNLVSRPDGGVYVRPIEEGGGITSVHPYEKWTYRHLEGLGQNIEIEFVDPTQTGKFQLAVFPWEKDALTTTGMGKTLAEETGLATRADRPALMPAAGGAGYGPESRFMRYKDTPFARYELTAKIQAPPITKHKALRELVQVNVKYDLLPFEVRQDFVRLNETQLLVPITVQVRNGDLTFKAVPGGQEARMGVYGSVTSLTNQIIHEFEDDILTPVRGSDPEKIGQTFSIYQKVIPVPRGSRYRLDLIVKDLNSGTVGAYRRAIIPPSFSEEKLSGSSLILSSAIQPLKDVPEKEMMFVLGDVKVLPKMDKRFTRSMPFGIYFQVYNALVDPTTEAPSLKVLYKLVKDGQVIKYAADENGESTQFFSGRRVVLVKYLSLEGLDPGEYQIQIEVTDRLSERRLELVDTFTVIP